MTAAGKRKFYIILGIADAVMLAAAAVLFCVIAGLNGSLSSQSTAERWGNGTRYDQLSAFIAPDVGANLSNIYSFEAAIQKNLEKNSITEASEDARLWVDCYSTRITLTVKSDREIKPESAEVNAICTGGDYFLFHPLEFICGNAYSPNSILQDQIVIDSSLAWRLFGSNDVVGKNIIINNTRFFVSGVVADSYSKAEKLARGENGFVYISYHAATVINDNVMPIITSYEACLPDPVKGVAENVFKDSVSVDETKVILVNNTARKKLIELLKQSLKLSEMTAVRNYIVFPYWENAARMTIFKAAGISPVAVGLLVIPFISLFIYARLLLKAFKRLVIRTKNRIIDKIEDKKYKRYIAARNAHS